jgi:serine kinase of HPr protein (carbohydrate metabolism regulator)
MIRHAGLVALRLGGAWRGVLIEGGSGAGKSDLALRALQSGFRLVADDRTLVWASGGSLFGRAPDALAGLIEVRGLGVLAEPWIGFAEIALVVDCVADAAVERAPDLETLVIAGVAAPRLQVSALEPSAPAKLRRALRHLGAFRQQAYLESRFRSSPCSVAIAEGLRNRPGH